MVTVCPDEPAPRPIRVVVADDDPRVLSAAADVLAMTPDVEVVAAVVDGHLALDLVVTRAVDVLVMDLGMPGGGVGLVRSVRETSPRTGLVVVTAQDDLGTCTELVRAGARCIVSKYGVDVDLGRCVVRCHHGDVVLIGRGPAAVVDHLLHSRG